MTELLFPEMDLVKKAAPLPVKYPEALAIAVLFFHQPHVGLYLGTLKADLVQGNEHAQMLRVSVVLLLQGLEGDAAAPAHFLYGHLPPPFWMLLL